MDVDTPYGYNIFLVVIVLRSWHLETIQPVRLHIVITVFLFLQFERLLLQASVLSPTPRIIIRKATFVCLS